MATLPTLVTAMAEVDGRDRKSVDHIARTIREAGYITTGKRGGGATDMTVREAANLIIALNGADLPKETPVAIDRFRSLKSWFQGSAADIRARVESYDTFPDPIKGVMDVHTFGEALEVLIDGVPDMVDSFHQYLMQGHAMDSENAKANLVSMLRLGAFGLDVTFSRYAGKIELFTMQGSGRRIEFEARFMQDTDRMAKGFYGRDWPDRRVQSTIGFYTLLKTWVTLTDNEDRLEISLDDKGTE